jgi:hypothetical protein
MDAARGMRLEGCGRRDEAGWMKYWDDAGWMT